MSNAIRSLYVDIRSNHERAVSGLREVDRAGDDAAQSMERAETASDNLAQRQRALEGALVGTAAVAAGAALALREIAQVGMQVDKTLSIVQATSGATESQMAAMRSEAKELGATMPLTMQEISSGFEQLSYAGYDAEQSIQAIASTSQLAVAGQLSLGEASQIVVSNLSAFNMEADQASSVADGLAATFATSATTINEASQALDYVSAAANSAGQSITQTNAAIGVLADNGMRGSRAGTSLMQMLTSLASPSGKASEALEQVGLSAENFTDQEGNFKDLTGIIRTLQGALEGLSEAERMQVLTDVFGARGSRAVAPLLDNVDELQTKLEQVAASDFVGSVEELEDIDPSKLEERLEGLDVTLEPGMDTEEVVSQFAALRDELSQEEMQAEIQAALNVDEDAAEILASDIEAGEAPEDIAAGLEEVVSASDLVSGRMDNLAGKLTYVRGSLEAFAYGAYEALKPVFMLGGDALVGLVDLLNSNEAIAKAFGFALLGLGTAAAVAATGIGVMLAEVYLTEMAMKAAAGGTYTYRAAQYASAAASKVHATAQLGLRGALLATAGGFKAAAIAAKGFMASLGPVGWALIAGSVALSAYMSNAFGLKDAVDQLLGPLGSFLGYLWDIASSGVGGVLSAIMSPLYAIGDAISWVVGLGTDLLSWFDSLGPAGRAPLIAIASAINPLLGGFLALRTALEYVGPAASAAGGALRALGRGAIWVLKTAFWPLIAAGKGLIRVGKWIASGLSAAGDAYADFTGAIDSSPGRALTGTLEAIGDASDWTGEKLSWLADATGTLFRVLSLFSPPGLVYWLFQAVTGSEDLAEKFGPLEPIMTRVFDAARFVAGALRELYDIGQLFSSWIVGRAINWVGEKVDAARKKFDSFKQGVYEAIDPFVQLYDWIQRIIDKVPDLPSKEDIPLVGGLFGGGGGEVTDANASAEEEGRGFIQNAWDSVTGDALPSVDEMRAEQESRSPKDQTPPRESPDSPEPPEPPEPAAPTGPAEPATPVRAETQGVDSPMDAVDPYAEGQRAGEQTAEGMATGIDRRMEIARQSAADLHQGVQEEAGGEVTGPDVRPGEQYEPEGVTSMPDRSPDAVGRTGYTPAVEAEPAMPSVESASLENAAEGADRARQFFPETTTDEETGETQETYREIPDTVGEMPARFRGTVSPQQPQGPPGPAMAAAGGGQAAVAAGATDAGLADGYRNLPDPRGDAMQGVGRQPGQPTQPGQQQRVSADVSRSSDGARSVDITINQNFTLNVENMDGLVSREELEQFGRKVQDRTETAVENGLLGSLEMTPKE